MSKLPLEQTLPRAQYVDAAAFRRECERIFFREWFCAGRTAELAEAGQYRLHRLAGEDVIVTRSRAGALHAFYNVCRHRGSTLVAGTGPGDGEAVESGRFPGGIRCPYHSWTYELDGTLRMAPHLDEKIDACRGELALHPVGLQCWGGFYFLNLDFHRAPGRPDLMTQLGQVPVRTTRYRLEELVSVRRIVYTVQANWKVIVENYNECYHCGPVHPELCEVVPAFRQQGGGGLDWDRGVPHKPGADTFSWSGRSDRASIPGLNADEQVLHKGELIYPNLMISLARDHAAVFRLWPEAVDRTLIVCEFLFWPDEVRKPGFDASDCIDFWDTVNRQDWSICERVQQGMHSRAFEAGYYAPMEDLSLDIRRYVLDRIGPTG